MEKETESRTLVTIECRHSSLENFATEHSIPLAYATERLAS